MTTAKTPRRLSTRVIAIISAAAVVAVAGIVLLLAQTRPVVDTDAAAAATLTTFHAVEEATVTADLRAAAAVASREADTLAAALDQPGATGSDASSGRRYLAVLDSLRELGSLDGDTLGRWAVVRADLAAALVALEPHAAPDLVASGQRALAATDALIASAKAALLQWQDERELVLAQRARQAEEAAEVRAYTATVFAQLRLYQTLREKTTVDVQPIYDDPEWGEINAVQGALWEGIEDRKAVLSALGALSPPSALVEEHSDVLALLQDAIQAMRDGTRGINEAQESLWQEQAHEMPLDVRAAPGWQSFSEESERLDAEYAAVWTALDEGTESLLAELAAPVPIPPKPAV